MESPNDGKPDLRTSRCCHWQHGQQQSCDNRDRLFDAILAAYYTTLEYETKDPPGNYDTRGCRGRTMSSIVVMESYPSWLKPHRVGRKTRTITGYFFSKRLTKLFDLGRNVLERMLQCVGARGRHRFGIFHVVAQKRSVRSYFLPHVVQKLGKQLTNMGKPSVHGDTASLSAHVLSLSPLAASHF
ncbi:hypothetical protein PsorP6_007046 [Peronosclerospora sorghi]|uniref:Uncharacterized protein n=1 Tax=Peronosclerospora sorghi TaxID=230839 RepID=A0ACC0W8G5_9STRA|nr:hypothetical protein PsorP6_007046 [Peronosclerospora sorghi]